MREQLLRGRFLPLTLGLVACASAVILSLVLRGMQDLGNAVASGIGSGVTIAVVSASPWARDKRRDAESKRAER